MDWKPIGSVAADLSALYVEQLGGEGQHAVARNGASNAAIPISRLRRAGDACRAAGVHALQRVGPARNDASERKFSGGAAAVRAGESFAVGQRALVVTAYLVGR